MDRNLQHSTPDTKGGAELNVEGWALNVRLPLLNHRGTGQVPAIRSCKPRSGNATEMTASPPRNRHEQSAAAGVPMDIFKALPKKIAGNKGLQATSARQNTRRREARPPS